MTVGLFVFASGEVWAAAAGRERNNHHGLQTHSAPKQLQLIPSLLKDFYKRSNQLEDFLFILGMWDKNLMDRVAILDHKKRTLDKRLKNLMSAERFEQKIPFLMNSSKNKVGLVLFQVCFSCLFVLSCFVSCIKLYILKYYQSLNTVSILKLNDSVSYLSLWGSLKNVSKHSRVFSSSLCVTQACNLICWILFLRQVSVQNICRVFAGIFKLLSV